MDRHPADAELGGKFIELGRAGPQHVIKQYSTPLGWSERAFGFEFVCCVRHVESSLLLAQEALAAESRPLALNA